MARVYERPRYINQARNRLLALATHTHDYSLRIQVARAIHCSPNVRATLWEDYEDLAEAAYDGIIDSHHEIGIDSQLSDYLLDSEIGVLANSPILGQPEPCTKLIKDYLSCARKHKPRDTLTDECAMFYLMWLAYSDQMHRAEEAITRDARAAAYNLIHHQLAAQKISPAQFTKTFARAGMSGPASQLVVNADAWLRIAEQIQYRSQPMWVRYCRLWASPPRRVRLHVATMIEKVEASGACERHRIQVLDGCGHEYSAYNYSGIIVIFINGIQLILDSSTADYFRTAMTAYRNACIAFSMVRVAGDTGKTDYTSDFRSCMRWIRDAIKDVRHARYMARHMHLAYTRWQNSACEYEADIDCGWEERDRSLAADMVEYYPSNTSWWDLVMHIDCPERVKGEFLKLYHLLPPPDIDPLLLHDTLIERTSHANVANPVESSKFFKFCKAYDLSRFMAKNRRIPHSMADDLYQWQQSTWAKQCLSGKFTMPPEAEWGMAQISKEFPYPYSGDFHVLSAKDCTRVVADLGAYMDRSRSRSMKKQDANELLSALFNGEILSNGLSMSEWRERVMRGELNAQDVSIAAEAGKAENTKPGKKVRETLSACDTLREYLTEVDHSLRPLAELTPGVSIRMNMVRHKKKFQEMSRVTSQSSTKRAFATSTDITGWSPKMDRDFFHRWQEYALSTTECAQPRAQVKLWDQLQLFVDRRGVKEVGACPRGNIQGWPATSDTTMHAHILIYWVYKLKARGLLSQSEAAYTLCLIDDATTVVALDGSIEECVAKAKAARELLASTYLDMGFEMDEIKSFFSSVKFVYLNELYIDGTQVGHGTKTMMRIDKDHSRRFSSLTENIATAFGTAASAAAQGADPFVAYYIAATLAFRWAFQVEPRLLNLGPIGLLQVALCPASLNGLGIRAITSVFSTGENDHLTWFIEVAGVVTDIAGSTVDRRTFSAILSQPCRVPDAEQTASMPFAYIAASHQSAAGVISRTFRDAARSIGFAEPFLSLDKIEASSNLECALESVLKAGQHEAALLEEVMSNSPSALIKQVLARVEKTEIVAYLLGARGIGRLRRIIQTTDQFNLHSIYTAMCGVYAPSELKDYVLEAFGRHSASVVATGIGSFQVAHNLREAMYAQTEWQVLNHTYPCPFALWAFAGEIDLDSAISRKYTTVSFRTRRLRKTIGSNGSNLYDSAVEGIGYRAYITARSEADREVRVAFQDPVRRMLATGLAAFRWARVNGAHYAALFSLFCQSWCGAVDPRLLDLKGKTLMGSAKRLSLRHNKSSHASQLFLNVQSAVQVDARAITTAQADYSSMYDVMAAITALRTAGLLEVSLLFRSNAQEVSYAFSYHPRSEARMVVPARDEEAVDMAAIQKITPLSSMPVKLAASVKVCCSYDSMATLAATYYEVGERAARKLFDGLVREEAIDPALLAAHEQQVVQFRDLETTTDTTRHSWVTRDAQSRQIRHDLVSEPGMSRASRVLTEVPRGTQQDQLRHVATAWDDTLLLDAVIRDAVFMEELKALHQTRNITGCLQMDKWDEKKDIFMLNPRQMRELAKEVDTVVSSREMAEAMAIVLRQMGMPGFRSRGTEGDLHHQLMSFQGTTAAHISRASHVGLLMRRLRHSSASDYSSIRLAQASSSKKTLSRVVRAQWLAAAARRHLRAADIVRRERSGVNATKPNYEAVYLRAAASLLTTSGKINMAAFWGMCITRTIQSLASHMGDGDKAEQYAAALDELGVDPESMCATAGESEVAITIVARAAEALDDSVDISTIAAAYRTVCQWVDSDLGGDHAMTPVTERRVHPSAAPVQQAPVPHLSEATQWQTPVLVQPVVIGDDSSRAEDMADVDPQTFCQWALTHTEPLQWMRQETGIENVHALYASVTASEDSYRALMRKLVENVSTETYIDYGFSMFDPPSWEAGHGDLVFD